MGRRELFIILAFVAAGLVAYQLSVPPSPDGQGFSLGQFIAGLRREVQGNPAQAVYAQRGTLPAPPHLAELRIANVTRRVDVHGEARTDIAYELQVESSGPDDAQALAYAQRTTVRQDDLGSVLTLDVDYPPEARQETTLVVRIPARLSVRVTSSRSIPVAVANVEAVHLEGAGGESSVSGIRRAVTGVHRGGTLLVEDAGAAQLTLTSSRATLRRVRQGVTLTLRSGECTVTESHGPAEVETTAADVTFSGHGGPVRLSGTGGRIRVDDPAEDVRIDTRRAEVEVRLARTVPLTVITTDDTLRLLLGDQVSALVDAVATGGRIQAGDYNLTPETTSEGARLSHTLGAGRAARVALRNTRGDIVIRRSR